MVVATLLNVCHNPCRGEVTGAIAEITQQELGRRLMQVRKAAGLKQAELARRITWSQAVLSRVESGERELSDDELKTVIKAIGTPEALQLSKSLAREWREIQRPPLDHPDQDLLWQAEQVCRELVELRNNPDVRHAFERRLSEYITGITQGASLILKARTRHRVHRQQGHRQVHGDLQDHRTGSARSGRRPGSAGP